MSESATPWLWHPPRGPLQLIWVSQWPVKTAWKPIPGTEVEVIDAPEAVWMRRLEVMLEWLGQLYAITQTPKMN